jgi:hypothetical protein
MEIEVTYRGVKLLVEGTYTPPEEQVMYYADGSGYPGSSADFDINAVFVQDTDIYELLSVMDLEEIVELVLEEISSF